MPKATNIICNPSLERSSLGIHCNRISPINNIEQERAFLFANEPSSNLCLS